MTPARTALMLFVLLAMCAIPLLVRLGDRDSTHTMERMALVSSQETWLRMHGVAGSELAPAGPGAWQMPSYNGLPRVRKPPLIVWLNLLAWSDLEPGGASVDDLILRARLVTVGVAMIALVATFWLGTSLGGVRLGLLAVMVMGTTVFFQRQARTASYDMHMLAWVTLAIAAGIWAMVRSRSLPLTAGSWLLAAAAMALGVLVKGPLAAIVTLLPLGLAAVVLRERWREHALWILATALVAAVLVLPWYLHAYRAASYALSEWTQEYQAARDEAGPPWYYVGLLALVLPWTLWLIGGLLLPFLKAGDLGRGEISVGPTAKRRALVPVVWFAAIFVMFSIPEAKSQRYILPILPAAALVIAWLWEYHARLADRGEVDPGVNLLRVPHWIGIALATVALGVWMVLRPPTGDWVAVAMIVLPCAAFAAIGARSHWRWKPFLAAACVTIWMGVAMTGYWMIYADEPSGRHPVRAELVEIERVAAGRAMGYVNPPPHPLRVRSPFLLYARRIVEPVAMDGLAAAPPIVFAPLDAAMPAGWRQRGEFREFFGDVPAVMWERVTDE